MIHWQDSYSVGVSAIDEQHQQLVDIINRLFAAMKSGQGQQELGQTFSRLIDYTKEHFSFEESLMEQYDYPEAYRHKQEHVGLTKRVVNLNEQFQSGAILLSVETSHFLKDWLLQHIQKTDQKFGSFLNSVGVA